jgi:uncharacterized protein (DUF58 family)
MTRDTNSNVYAQRAPMLGYDALSLALLRQAEVARRLRENGWRVIDRVAADSIHAAA